MEFDDAEGVHLAAVGQRAVVVIGNDALHGVAFVAGAGLVAAEGLGGVAVGIDEVGIVFVDHVHDAQRPAGRVPVRVVEVILKDALLRAILSRWLRPCRRAD